MRSHSVKKMHQKAVQGQRENSNIKRPRQENFFVAGEVYAHRGHLGPTTTTTIIIITTTNTTTSTITTTTTTKTTTSEASTTYPRR